MRLAVACIAVVAGLSAASCSVLTPGSASPVPLRETSPTRLLVEQLLTSMGFHDITRLTATSAASSLHGMAAYFQATATRGGTVYRISGTYDGLNGVAIHSMIPTGQP